MKKAKPKAKKAAPKKKAKRVIILWAAVDPKFLGERKMPRGECFFTKAEAIARTNQHFSFKEVVRVRVERS